MWQTPGTLLGANGQPLSIAPMVTAGSTTPMPVSQYDVRCNRSPFAQCAHDFCCFLDGADACAAMATRCQ